jgi:hypothetical protein
MKADTDKAVGTKWLLGVVVAILLSLTGAWAVTMTETDKELRAKDAQLEQKIQDVSTADAVKQERLKHIEEKLDEALRKLDKLAEK